MGEPGLTSGATTPPPAAAKRTPKPQPPLPPPWGWPRTLLTQVGLWVVTVAFLVGCVLVQGLLDRGFWTDSLTTYLGAALWIVGAAGAGLAGKWTSRTGGRHVLAFVLVCAPVTFLGASQLDGAVLAARGVAATTTVTAVSANVGNGAAYFYTLAEPDGVRVPGGTYRISAGSLPTSPYRVGDKIAVVYDPGGLVPPVKQGSADTHPSPVSAGIAGGLVVALLACFGWWGVLGERRRRRAAAALPR